MDFSGDSLANLAARVSSDWQIGLVQARDVVDGTVVRQVKAYPVYNGTYAAYLETLRAYLAAGVGPGDEVIVPAITFVANPDEEIGSPFSTPHIRRLAPEHDAVLVLECARANGDIVSARKGIADYHLTLVGRAAHAGVEPEKGRSAILEAAHQVVALHALNGRWPTVTVNAGVIRGGTVVEQEDPPTSKTRDSPCPRGRTRGRPPHPAVSGRSPFRVAARPGHS